MPFACVCGVHVCAPVCRMCAILVAAPPIRTPSEWRPFFLPSVVKLLAKRGGGIQTNGEHTANGSCQAHIAELDLAAYNAVWKRAWGWGWGGSVWG